MAIDSGPVDGHSLFTGCLIEGLTRGIRRGGNRVTTTQGRKSTRGFADDIMVTFPRIGT